MSCFHVVAVVRPFVFTKINQLMRFLLYYIELVTTINLSILKLRYIICLKPFLLLRITTKLYLQNCNIARNYGKLHFYMDIKTYIHNKQIQLLVIAILTSLLLSPVQSIPPDIKYNRSNMKRLRMHTRNETDSIRPLYGFA